jgi:hypothetical protein
MLKNICVNCSRFLAINMIQNKPYLLFTTGLENSTALEPNMVICNLRACNGTFSYPLQIISGC